MSPGKIRSKKEEQRSAGKKQKSSASCVRRDIPRSLALASSPARQFIVECFRYVAHHGPRPRTTKTTSRGPPDANSSAALSRWRKIFTALAPVFSRRRRKRERGAATILAMEESARRCPRFRTRGLHYFIVAPKNGGGAAMTMTDDDPPWRKSVRRIGERGTRGVREKLGLGGFVGAALCGPIRWSWSWSGAIIVASSVV
jgi:hypothetical protein